jgi:guanine nucleotide-binding protein subunit alpha
MDYDLDLVSPASTYCFPEDLALAVQQLWQDPVIPKLLDNHSSEFYLMDSAPLYVSPTS